MSVWRASITIALDVWAMSHGRGSKEDMNQLAAIPGGASQGHIWEISPTGADTGGVPGISAALIERCMRRSFFSAVLGSLPCAVICAYGN